VSRPGGRARFHVLAVSLLALTTAGLPSASAQTPGPQPVAQPSGGPEFLPRYNFQLSAAALSPDRDAEDYAWDTHFGATLDLFDYVRGRISTVADYEAILGSEFRPFDPNQASYTLEVSSSIRAAGTEVAGVFHHVSRHLSDRPKREAVAWNVLGVRVLRGVTLGRTAVGIRGGAGRLVEHAGVDYGWTADADVVARRSLGSRVAVYGRGAGELYTIDPSQSARGAQKGGRLEAGVRLNGGGGAVELFAGFERRIDAAPLVRLPVRWAFAGFRLVN
jgi:hypothetical protein